LLEHSGFTFVIIDALAKSQKWAVFGLVTYWYYRGTKTKKREFASASSL